MNDLHQRMKFLVKERAVRLLGLDEKVERLSQAIDDGDTNIFFLAMFGKDVMLKAKLIMSLQTSFGMSFYEQISKSLGELAGFEVNNQFKLSGFIPDEVSRFLERTLDDVSYKPNRSNEYRMLSELYSEAKQEGRIGDLRFTPDSTVDVFIKTPDGTEIFIDITTVKPNKKEFRTMKRKILTWYFMRLSHGDISPDKIKTYMAIPYNPESSESNVYTRWNDYYDSDDLLVGDQLWRLVSNDHFSLSDMLDVFVELGDEYQERITNCF
ncbi:TdeIII family type II restriction endonuclease [Providencia rettgeri]|uniref:TdeIII family type II restriction endonuclease n=3 Tax=Morganellaceae TaxID=1903414 RepID=UPI0032DA1220